MIKREQGITQAVVDYVNKRANINQPALLAFIQTKKGLNSVSESISKPPNSWKEKLPDLVMTGDMFLFNAEKFEKAFSVSPQSKYKATLKPESRVRKIRPDRKKVEMVTRHGIDCSDPRQI